jgi:antimicrobial peptide system SdpA family protein
MSTSSATLQQPSQEHPGPGQDDRRLGRRVVAAGVLATTVVVYVLHAALPATPFKLPFERPRAIRTVLPEGWAFFTLSPRTPRLAVFGAQPDGGWQQLTVGAHFEPRTSLSLDRRNRSQGTETAIVMNQVPPGDWSSCDRGPTACLSSLRPTRTIANTSTHRTLCGDVGLTAQEALPWAWRDLPTVMPSKVARVVVAC